MFPFEFVSESVHAPLPIFPFNVSPLITPVEVIGNSLVMCPNDVRAVT